nr:MAG TPA: hypothetical protein [Caudoviricetes sp.]
MEELNGYAPPVSLNLNDFQYDIGDAVVRVIAKMGIRVNREELLKALKYDRGQYKAGYDAGFADGLVETLHTVRCWQCNFYDPAKCSIRCTHPKGLCNPVESDFCSYGQRRAQSADVRKKKEGAPNEP